MTDDTREREEIVRRFLLINKRRAYADMQALGIHSKKLMTLTDEPALLEAIRGLKDLAAVLQETVARTVDVVKQHERRLAALEPDHE